MADDHLADEQNAAIEAEQAQSLRAEHVRTQQAQQHRSIIAQQIAARSHAALAAGAEAVIGKLGAQGLAIAAILRFFREHKTLGAIVLTILGAFLLFILAVISIFIYYAINPCETLKLPLSELNKLLITLSNLQCAVK